MHLDLADNQSVRSAAQEIKSITGQIHGLINSAGIMAPATFSTSKDGLEMQFASNHLGHFLLTNLVISEIKKAKGVVVNVSSAGYQVADPEFDDVNFNVRGRRIFLYNLLQRCLKYHRVEKTTTRG